ncbi:MAG TPA: SpoIIE family protein phosphatase [Gaiella sp.]
MFRWNDAVRGRLLLAMLLALLVLLSIALLLAWRQYEGAKDDAVQEVRARAILAATVFDTYFAGRLSVLTAVAAAPGVPEGDTTRMTTYFRRLQKRDGNLFPAGIGWIDRQGRQRATSMPTGPTDLNLGNRSYVRQVFATGKPFVSEAIVARLTKRRLVVMAVPTRDRAGRVDGVLAGGIILRPSRTNQRTIDLGYEGLEVVDRRGQRLSQASLAKVRNVALLARLRAQKEGVAQDVRGIDSEGDHVVAFATSSAPDWITVIDRPASSVFAAARRTFILTLSLIGAAAACGFLFIGAALLRSRRELQAEDARLASWAAFTRALGETRKAREIGDLVVRSLAEQMPRAAVAVVVRELDGSERTYSAVARGAAVTTGADAESDALRRAETLYEQPPEAVDGSPSTEESDRWRYGTSMTDGTTVFGAVAVAMEENGSVTERQRSFVHAHAMLARQSLGRIKLHESEHEIAVTLQQSLLPAKLPSPEFLEFGAWYQSGEVDAQVGGDWYDIVRRPDGVLHMTVGDVAGRGLEAAVLMGQLRNAFRAYALDVTSPAEILHRMSRHLDEDKMATATCVTFDPYVREITYASAGHPPPILIENGTRTWTRLDAASGPPLGWPADTHRRDAYAVVAGSATLALYTDGLVERRGTDLDDEIDTLSANIARLPLRNLDTDAAELVTGMSGGADDDAALLLVRIDEVPSAMQVQIPAQSEELSRLRRRLRSWMLLRGIEQDEREAAVLAVSEACNNAIEHAYRERTGVVRIHVSHDADALRISIEDDGVWRDPEPREERGNGLVLMKSFMDSAVVSRTRRGTRIELERVLTHTGVR